MGSSLQVYTTLKEKEDFSYANVRKASYRGSKTIINIENILIINIISFQVLRDLGNIPNLVRRLLALRYDDQD